MVYWLLSLKVWTTTTHYLIDPGKRTYPHLHSFLGEGGTKRWVGRPWPSEEMPTMTGCLLNTEKDQPPALRCLRPGGARITSSFRWNFRRQPKELGETPPVEDNDHRHKLLLLQYFGRDHHISSAFCNRFLDPTHAQQDYDTHRLCTLIKTTMLLLQNTISCMVKLGNSTNNSRDVGNNGC